MGAGPRRKLTACRLAAAERARDLGEVEAEHVVQQETRPLHGDSRSSSSMSATEMSCAISPAAGVVEHFIDHRLRQPLARHSPRA